MTRNRDERMPGRIPLAAAAVFLLCGCDLGIQNPGRIADEDLNDPSLMGVVVNGIANEFNIATDNLAFDVARLTDEMAGTGSYFQTGRYRRGAQDWEETDGQWGFFHETIWTAGEAIARMEALEDFDQSTSPLASRAYLLMGLAHRMYGETFCEVVYDEGPVQPRTAAFDSAIAALNLAITIGGAAGAGADDYVTAARAGLAQAYMGKGDFVQATTYSTQVPTNFEMSAIFNLNANQNLIYDETHDRPEIGHYNTYSGTLATQDPRAPFTICGTFDNPDDPKNSDVTSTGLCTAQQGADGVTAHWRQEKYNEDGSDIPVAKGTDMRLIEAEAALRSGDLAGFTSSINEVRAFYELDPIDPPATAGELEYPNAYDASSGDVTAPGVDGWSILDGERHLTLFMEGRREWDLHRWDHPFLDGGIVFWDSEPRRASCWPVPEIECTLNDNLKGTSLQSGVGSGTVMCG